MNPINILIFIVIFLLVAFYVQSLVQPDATKKISDFLSNNVAPNIPFYQFIKDNVGAGNLLGVISFTVFANMPILPSPPTEAYVIFAFIKGTNPVLIVLVVSIITAVTTSINYLIGYIFGPKLIEKITKRDFKYNRIINFLSAPITFFTHLLPIPIGGLFSILFGAYKSNYRNFIVAAILGTLIKFSLVLFLFSQYSDVISKIPLIKLIF